LDFYEQANMARSVSHTQFPLILDVFRKAGNALIGEPLKAPVLKKLLTVSKD
jgi:hypothetical protein